MDIIRILEDIKLKCIHTLLKRWKWRNGRGRQENLHFQVKKEQWWINPNHTYWILLTNGWWEASPNGTISYGGEKWLERRKNCTRNRVQPSKLIAPQWVFRSIVRIKGNHTEHYSLGWNEQNISGIQDINDKKKKATGNYPQA